MKPPTTAPGHRDDRIAPSIDRRAEGNAAEPNLPEADWFSYADFAEQTRRHLTQVEPSGCVGVVAVDIDHYEALTSMHGGVVATEILTVAANRIREAVRPHDVIARVDGNGFALAWRQQIMTPAPADIGSRIARRFEAPVETSAGELAVTVTIGVVTADYDEARCTEPHALLAQARAAVVASRAHGRSRITEFDPVMLEHAVQTYTTECQLRVALRNESLSVDYQPIVSLTTGGIVAVEALARWHDERFGWVSPALFIPIAEDSGLINDVGRLVLRTSIAQGAAWGRDRGGNLMLTVNLSNNQLLDPSLIPMIKRLLTQHSLEPSQLCLEITESVVMSNVAASMTILCKLKDLGVVLAIDDFGTGYSSLSYLRRLPVDILKIDRSFIQSLHEEDDQTITKVIIDLAHTLGMTTVAEGVETAAQMNLLRELGCDMAQGFLLRRPNPPDSVDLAPIDLRSIPADAVA
ncbi:MAG: GGDEF domain-containing phosphodiesterase [Actinomycetota bacterium]